MSVIVGFVCRNPSVSCFLLCPLSLPWVSTFDYPFCFLRSSCVDSTVPICSSLSFGVCFRLLPGQSPMICTKKKLKLNILKPWSRWKGLYASTMFIMMMMLSIRSSSIIMTFWCFCASWSETYRTCCVSLLSDPEVLTLYSSPVRSSVIPMHMSSANRDTPECFHMLVRTLKLLQKPSPWSVHEKAAVDRIKVKPDKGQEQCKVTHTTSVLGRDLKRNALWDSSNIWTVKRHLKAECPHSSVGIFWNIIRGRWHDGPRSRAYRGASSSYHGHWATPPACPRYFGWRGWHRLAVGGLVGGLPTAAVQSGCFWRQRCSRNINQCEVERIIMRVWRYKPALITQSKNRFHLSPPPTHLVMWPTSDSPNSVNSRWRTKTGLFKSDLGHFQKDRISVPTTMGSRIGIQCDLDVTHDWRSSQLCVSLETLHGKQTWRSDGGRGNDDPTPW